MPNLLGWNHVLSEFAAMVLFYSGNSMRYRDLETGQFLVSFLPSGVVPRLPSCPAICTMRKSHHHGGANVHLGAPSIANINTASFATSAIAP